MQNGTAVPWVFFEEPAGVQYLSADARRLAVKGTEGAAVTSPPPIRQQGNCGGKNAIESTLCGLQNAPGVDPAIGGLLGGLLGR